VDFAVASEYHHCSGDGKMSMRESHGSANVIDHIGHDDDGKPTEVLFGGLAMQQWGIRLIREQEKIDLSHYPTEFVEF
jgi:hypothetical protein